MSNAHKGSRLQLKDEIIPVGFDSAHFDFNRDESGVRFGKLIEPSGGAVFTIRPVEGKFGGAISVEKGTTNLWSGGINIYNNFASNGQMTASLTPLSETFMGYPIYRLTMTPISSNAVNDVKSNLYSHGVESNDTFTFASGTTYMSSVYWRPVNKDDITVGGEASNISGWSDISTYSANGNWNYSVSKMLNTISGGGIDRKYWSFDSPSAVANEPIIIDWACPQVEQSTYSTSYVSGNARSNGMIKYDRELISPKEGCISFWMYATSSGNSGGNPNPIFSAGYDGCFDLLMEKTTGAGYLRFYTSGNASTQLRPNLKYDAWSHVVVYWKRNIEVGIYIDGVLDSYNQTPVDWEQFYWDNATGFYLGSGIRSNPQIMISDLRIDRKMPTAEDIGTWYLSGRPFFNPFDGRAYAL